MLLAVASKKKKLIRSALIECDLNWNNSKMYVQILNSNKYQSMSLIRILLNWLDCQPKCINSHIKLEIVSWEKSKQYKEKAETISSSTKQCSARFEVTKE